MPIFQHIMPDTRSCKICSWRAQFFCLGQITSIGYQQIASIPSRRWMSPHLHHCHAYQYIHTHSIFVSDSGPKKSLLALQIKTEVLERMDIFWNRFYFYGIVFACLNTVDMQIILHFSRLKPHNVYQRHLSIIAESLSFGDSWSRKQICSTSSSKCNIG